MSANGNVQSLNRALDMLEMISRHRGHMAIGEVAEACGIPLPTAHRLLKTLADRGYIRRLSNRHYALGSRLLSLGLSVNALLGAEARTLLLRLVDELEQSATMAVLSGDRAEYLAHVPSMHTTRTSVELGRRVELHSTSVGKAILASLPLQEVRDIVRRAGLPKATEFTVTSEGALLAQLVEIRQRGYAIADSEREVGIRALAVPIPGSLISPMAISIIGPVERLTEAAVGQAIPVLQAAAAEFSRQISLPEAPQDGQRKPDPA